MTKELDEYFDKRFVFDFDNHWVRYSVDDSIREFVKEEFGFSSFYCMTNSAKKTLY